MIRTNVKKTGEHELNKRIVIVSDTHITPTGTDFNQEIFDKGIEKINRIKDVTAFVHLGDITHGGTLLEYNFAFEQSKKFDPVSKAPIFYLIGNHDALNVGYRLFEELFGKRHFEYEDEDIYMIGFDSTKPDLPGGVIHHNTIDAISKRLTTPERSNKIKIVCFHHQLIPIPNTGKERSAIDDSGNMLEMLLNAKADLVLNGHRHISNLYKISNSEKDLYIFNSGTFSSNKTRYRELFTYNIIDIRGKDINFKVIPILEPKSKMEINRTIAYYSHRKVKSGEQPYCKFIQLCNTLISTDMVNNTTNFDKAIEKINKIQDVDLLVHAGNLTRNSFKEEFKLAREKIKSIDHPCLVVPGHTDSKPPAWTLWDKYIGSLNPLYENEKILFQGIDSTTPDSKVGFIGRKKLNRFIEKVLSLSHKKIFGVCCFHTLIPTPLSVWRTELMDSGDVLSQFARSQISLVLNSTPSISFNIKIDNSIFSNAGSLDGRHFDPTFIEIDLYKDGLVVLSENNLRTGKKKVINKYQIEILS